MPEQKLFQRQTALIRMNVTWLNQALQMLDTLDETSYAGIGAQLRHVIEFYECFLDGLERMHVDYDARRRDPRLQQDPGAAAERIRALIARLTMEPELRGDGAVWVRVEDATALAIPEPFLLSSVGRELQSLSSHTVHHYALIAVTLRAAGHRVEETFGVAPSTLRYREEARAASNLHLVPAAAA